MKIFEVTGTPQIFGKYKNQVKRRYRCTGLEKEEWWQIRDCSSTHARKEWILDPIRAKKKGIQGARAGYTKKYNPSKIAKN